MFFPANMGWGKKAITSYISRLQRVFALDESTALVFVELLLTGWS